MKKFRIAVLAASIASGVLAQERPAGYAPLENYIGRWTVSGSEGNYLEVCAWYPGNFHVACNTERKNEDGSTGHNLSILSYVPEQGYVYSGISSTGRYETLHGGTFKDGVFEFLSTEKSVVTRIRIGPFSKAGFPFVVDSSTSDGKWTDAETIDYIRLD